MARSDKRSCVTVDLKYFLINFSLEKFLSPLTTVIGIVSWNIITLAVQLTDLDNTPQNQTSQGIQGLHTLYLASQKNLFLSIQIIQEKFLYWVKSKTTEFLV